MILWSISTTLRNPERILPFLKVLKLLEGLPFNEENQILYQILLIQHRLYKPTNIPTRYKELFKNPLEEIPLDIAREVFDLQNYESPAMRGRQSASPITKLGFCIARESEGEVVITELGNKFINGDYDIGYAFFKSLLKLQFPNPWSSDFSARKGFNIMPLIATFHLINKVNQISDKKGLTQTEFSLFVPSLINFDLIDYYVGRIIEYRASNAKADFVYEFAQEFYEEEEPSEKQINNFFEYGDNIMRYFRLTRYFRVRNESFGGDWRIDIEPTRQLEVQQILSQFTGEAQNFENVEAYLKYISDISLPRLPSEDINNAKLIAKSLIETIQEYSKTESVSINIDEEKIINLDFMKFNKSEIDNFILLLRKINIDLKERKIKQLNLQNTDRINFIIQLLNDNRAIKKIGPEKLEQLLTDSLRIINDEILIKPNYPVDDNGEPISHAAGNQPDIECYYKMYNAIYEVTLDNSNFQWVRESQPVMRHLRAFEDKFIEKICYCLFIAPKVHIDTVYHFWTSLKYGYNGKTQKIIPLTTSQFAILLEVLLDLITKQRRFKHTEIQDLYDGIIKLAEVVNGHEQWLNSIDNQILEWKKNILISES